VKYTMSLVVCLLHVAHYFPSHVNSRSRPKFLMLIVSYHVVLYHRLSLSCHIIPSFTCVKYKNSLRHTPTMIHNHHILELQLEPSTHHPAQPQEPNDGFAGCALPFERNRHPGPPPLDYADTRTARLRLGSPPTAANQALGA
jgi:hypothetical protein